MLLIPLFCLLITYIFINISFSLTPPPTPSWCVGGVGVLPTLGIPDLCVPCIFNYWTERPVFNDCLLVLRNLILTKWLAKILWYYKMRIDSVFMKRKIIMNIFKILLILSWCYYCMFPLFRFFQLTIVINKVSLLIKHSLWSGTA